MSIVTFVWGAIIGACVTMALPHLLIGIRRRAWQNLFFALAALAGAGIAGAELAILQATTTAQIGRAQQWVHVPIFFLAAAIVGFVHLSFGTGRLWLGISGCLMRFVTLLINFAAPPNLNFRSITGLRHLDFFGDTVAMPEGVSSPWTHLSELSSLLILAFVADATLALWRRGGRENRRRATLIGGSIALFIALAAGLSALVNARMIQMPYLVSVPFVGVILAMGLDLSSDILRAAQTEQQLRTSEAALRESEARVGLAASAANLGHWCWDIQRDDVWITKEGRALFGFAEFERINLDRFLGAIDGEDRAPIAQRIQKSLASGGEYESEYRIVQPDGRKLWLAGYGRTEFDERGKPILMRGMTRNITKRKMAEQALLESNSRFRAVADSAPVMIWMSGPDKLCNFFNKGWFDFTGRTPAQELGNGWTEGVHREDLAHCLEVYENAFDGRQPFTMEYRLRRKDGEYRWILDSGTPRTDLNGIFLGYIGSCVDITDRRQAELDHQVQSTELARVGRVVLMGELAASLAHEVNNPVGAMVANASAGQRLIARGHIAPEELSELLSDIVADGHRAREVIEGIRNMVRRSEATHAPIQTADILKDLLRIVRADALARNITINMEIDPNAGRIMGDRVQLLQVFLNLTLNAFEAMSVMRPDVRCLLIRAHRAGNSEVLVSVRDSGPGFPASIAGQLFEPFFSTKSEGTGMGLAIARSIVEAHGGSLAGTNCEDGGASFTVQLSAADAQSADGRAGGTV
jgi:two-component system, LuxR family, sensor kinase FixL